MFCLPLTGVWHTSLVELSHVKSESRCILFNDGFQDWQWYMRGKSIRHQRELIKRNIFTLDLTFSASLANIFENTNDMCGSLSKSNQFWISWWWKPLISHDFLVVSSNLSASFLETTQMWICFTCIGRRAIGFFRVFTLRLFDPCN